MAKQEGRLAGAAAWTFASRVVAQGTQLTVFLVAARFLVPAEFGVFALLSAVHMLMMKLSQAGWTEFGTSWTGEPDVDAHAFTWAAGLSGAIAALGLTSALIFTWIPAVAPYATLQLLLSLSVVGVGPNAVWAGLLYRRQRGDVLAKAVVVAELAGSAVAVLGLLGGWKFLALGMGKLVNNFVSLAFIGLAVRWWPRFRFTSSGRDAIVQFTKSMLTSHVIQYSRAHTATLLLGLFLGPTAVGLYRAAERVVGALAETIAEPARTVCWMALRRTVDENGAEPEAQARAIAAGTTAQAALIASSERFITLVLLLAAPVFLGLSAVSESVVTVVLGQQWLGSAPVMCILAIARLVALQSILTLPLLSMVKRVDRVPALAFLSGMAIVIALPICAPFGVVWTAVGQLAAAMVGFYLAAETCSRYAAVCWSRALFRGLPSVAASLAMVAVLVFYRPWVHGFSADMRLHLAAELMLGVAVFLPLFTLLGGWRQLAQAYVLVR